ncbi:MAG TPA: SGNH/GDSL hydrolase family protein [Thermomonas sp.]|nr:SGNH/GDSL hydrolase family protein [Thermomonas sp.]HPM56936.1 SGNH/GDSL hydrolase family protein [Thermomonas sp.]
MPPRLLFGLSLGLLLAPFASVQAQEPAPKEYRVLLVGNSLTYTNNLPALLRAVGASQGTPITTETYAAPGGTLSERWRDGKAAEALRTRNFDVVVLQEIGGQVGCLASASRTRTAPCAATMQAHEAFAALARERGAKTLLFTTWSHDERMQGRINGGMRKLAKENDATVFNAAGAIASLHKAQPDSTPYPDGTHPSTQASLMMAVALYRDITGNAPAPKALRMNAPLLPVNAAVSAATPLETQSALAGDNKVTVVPVALIEPLVKALPDPKDEAKDVEGRDPVQEPGRRGR